MALRTPYKKRRPIIPHFIRVLEREITQTIQARSERLDRYPQAQSAAICRADKVREEELPDR